MSTSTWPSAVVPAQLSFLAIYNPTLGPSDESFPDQLVFYHSRAVHEARIAAKKSGRKDSPGEDVLREEQNEKLRQIGFAQGMVDFAKWVPVQTLAAWGAVMTEQTDRSFSDGEPVDSIETDRSRIVQHELEKGWWILAVGEVGADGGGAALMATLSVD